jgi:UDP-N-acetylglucosamine 2-epimerase (non-hydrolysing)
VRVLVVIGTRPEAIKLAPVILELGDRARICVTSQHGALVDQALRPFGIVPDVSLTGTADTLCGSLARIVEGMERVLRDERPDWVVVEGDTTTVLAAGLAAFYTGTPVAHVEAGLRSGDVAHPFPEEAHRRMVAVVTRLHLAHTEHARANLVAEGIPDEAIVVTGNPGLDALRLMAPTTERTDPPLLLVTVHRRESWGPDLDAICRAIGRIARTRDVRVVLPVHPSVEGSVRAILGGVVNVALTEPLPYPELVALLARCTLVLTDSGGLQEEAPARGKPVLVMRETTERPEGVEAGAAIIVGRDEAAIASEALALLDDPERYARMAVPRLIYGDGYAAPRIVAALSSGHEA